jgi:hypothetical protein
MLANRDQSGAGIGTRAALTLLVLSLGAALVNATDLKQTTLQAWDAYIKTVVASMDDRAAGRRQFLWVDESPALHQRVRGGEVVVMNHVPAKISNGMITHWIGAVFVPGATLEQVSRVLSDYDRYKEIYRPVIVNSKLLDRESSIEKANFLFMQKAFGVTAAVETDNEIQVTKLDAARIYSVSNSVRVQEIANYGQPDQHALPQDHGPGYVYRTFSITRLEQRDGGVYIESESLALSRSIPFEFRVLVKPLTEHLPRNLMLGTLNNSRTAITKEIEASAKRSETEQTASHQ